MRISKKEAIEKENKLKEKKELAKKGVVVGSALTGLGAGSAGLSSLGKKVSDKVVSRGGVPVDPKQLAILKKGGIAVAAVGAPLLGYSAYKHYKLKKDDNKA